MLQTHGCLTEVPFIRCCVRHTDKESMKVSSTIDVICMHQMPLNSTAQARGLAQPP